MTTIFLPKAPDTFRRQNQPRHRKHKKQDWSESFRLALAPAAVNKHLRIRFARMCRRFGGPN